MKLFRHILMASCMLVMLVGCGDKGNNIKSDVLKNSPLDVFQKSTIYHVENADLSKLSNSYMYIDTDNNTERSVLDYNTKISIKDSGDLDITVDNISRVLTITSDDKDKLKQIYEDIINSLKSEKTKYLMLYSHLELDGLGNITNIVYSEADNVITFDFSNFDEIDTRFIDLYYSNYNTYNIEDNINNNVNFFISDNVDENTEFYIMKNDAVYGLANDEVGIQALNSLESSNSNKFFKIGDKVYQGITMKSVIEAVDSEIEYPKTQVLNFDQIKDVGSETKLTVYFKEEAEPFKDDISEYMRQAGFRVIESNDYRDCNLIIGYTWLYNNSLQSSMDDRLATELINYHNKSNITDRTVRLLLRTSWGLGEKHE